VSIDSPIAYRRRRFPAGFYVCRGIHFALRGDVTVRPPQTLAAVRTHALSKAWAVFFIVLILLPFTAPFPTFDLGGTTSTHAVDCFDKTKTAADDLAVMTPPAGEPVRGLLVTELAPAATRRIAPALRPLRAVLRL